MNSLGVGCVTSLQLAFAFSFTTAKCGARINEAVSLLFSPRNTKEWPTGGFAAPGKSVRNTIAVDQSS